VVVAPSKPHPWIERELRVARSPMRDLKEGIAYVRTMPRMRAVMWIAFLANLTAYPCQQAAAYIAREIYGTNQTGLDICRPATRSAHYRVDRAD
jgi:hypothetical protein